MKRPSNRPRAPRFRLHRGRERFAQEWEALIQEIEQCTRCPLHRTRKKVVIYRGSLRPTVVFVGEAPGTKEDEVGLPFVGRAGKLLDRAIGELGLSADEVGILNLFKCHPPENRFNALAAETCRPYLERQLELLRPRLLVSLGAHALRQLDPNPASLTAAAGAPRSQSHQILFPLFHPAATFRSRAAAQRWKHDLEELRRSLPRLVSKGL